MENTSKWNQPHKAAKRTESGVSVWRGAIAALVVVVGAAIAFWLVGGHDSEDVKPKEKPQAKTSLDTPKPVERRSPSSSPAENSSAPDVQKVHDAGETNQWRMVNGFKVPPGARLVRNSLTNRTERVFKHASDALIASYLQQPQGGIMPPPLPMVGNAGKKFLESLATPIEILETDSMEVRHMKESVIIAREQIKQRMDEGEAFEDILTEHWKLSSENARIRREAQRALDAIYSEGDLDGATRYKQVADLALQKLGAEALDEPMTHAERKIRRHEENEARENAVSTAEGQTIK